MKKIFRLRGSIKVQNKKAAAKVTKAILTLIAALGSVIHWITVRIKSRRLLVDLWRDACDALEHPAEILHIGDSALQGDGL